MQDLPEVILMVFIRIPHAMVKSTRGIPALHIMLSKLAQQ